jgi:hypothetical protein
MRRLLDWLRFRGWRNAYWREDAIIARCSHLTRTWIDADLWCVDCGTCVGPAYRLVQTVSSSNITISTVVNDQYGRRA